MRLHEIMQYCQENNSDEIIYPHISEIEHIIPNIVIAAQEIYDAWDERMADELNGGGICHIIAEEILSLLYPIYSKYSEDSQKYTTTSSNFEQHVYVICVAKNKRGTDMIYSIDIPHGYYETGGGFSWDKIPDVKFTNNMVHISELSTATDWTGYTEEY